MSRDPRDYYASSRSDDIRLPPIREMVGDALARSPVSPYRFDLQAVDHALPSANKSYGMGPVNLGGQYPREQGPTLAPLRNYPPAAQSPPSDRRERSQSPPAEPGHRDHRARTTAPHHYHHHHHHHHHANTRPLPHPTAKPQPATGALPYSYNVLRTQQGDLVDVRTPSSRAQGILRPTALIDDEDDSHKRYRCDWPGCDKKYDRPSSLEVHRHTHTGKQPYPCRHPGCPRAFNVKSNMLRHFRSHSKVQAPQTSGSKEDQDSDSDKEEESEPSRWPQGSSTSRYFHAERHPSSSSSSVAKHHTTVSEKIGASPTSTSSSSQYHTSSRPR